MTCLSWNKAGPTSSEYLVRFLSSSMNRQRKLRITPIFKHCAFVFVCWSVCTLKECALPLPDWFPMLLQNQHYLQHGRMAAKTGLINLERGGMHFVLVPWACSFHASSLCVLQPCMHNCVIMPLAVEMVLAESTFWCSLLLRWNNLWTSILLLFWN